MWIIIFCIHKTKFIFSYSNPYEKIFFFCVYCCKCQKFSVVNSCVSGNPCDSSVVSKGRGYIYSLCPLSRSWLHSRTLPQWERFIGVSGYDAKGKRDVSHDEPAGQKGAQEGTSGAKGVRTLGGTWLTLGKNSETWPKIFSTLQNKKYFCHCFWNQSSDAEIILRHQIWRKQTDQQHMPRWNHVLLPSDVVYLSCNTSQWLKAPKQHDSQKTDALNHFQ